MFVVLLHECVNMMRGDICIGEYLYLIYMIMCWSMECVPRHMSDCNEQVGIVNVIPGENGLSWYS